MLPQFFNLVPPKGEGRESAGAADESHGRRGRGGKERQGQGDLDGDVDVSGPGHRAKVILIMMVLVALMSVFMSAMAGKAGCSLLL